MIYQYNPEKISFSGFYIKVKKDLRLSPCVWQNCRMSFVL